MILYDPALALRFGDYGILIPVLDSRADAVAEGLHAVLHGHDESWLRRGVVERIQREDLERVHDPEYVRRLYAGGPELEAELLQTYELIGSDGRPHRYAPDRAVRPLSALFDTILLQVAGTYQAARLALEGGFCYFLGGGMHHARRDGGSGFCLLNDAMIALARLRAEGRSRRVWIIDLDAHKGDGTAELARGDPDTLTLSIHMAAGWPLDAAGLEAARRQGRGPDRAPLAPSDVDIAVGRGEEALYNSRLDLGLRRLEALSGGDSPDLAIVVDGADPYVHDALPSTADLALSLDQCVARDLLVLEFLRSRDIPSAWLLAGGYGPRAFEVPTAFLARVLG